MMKLTKDIFQTTIWYTAGAFLIQGISFVTTPVFSRVMSPEDFGIVAVYSLWVTIFGAIVGLQSNAAIANARITFGEDKLNEFTSSVLTLSIINFSILLIIILTFQNEISALLSVRKDLVLYIILESFFSFCITYLGAKYVSLKQPKKYVLLSMINATLTVVLALFLVFYFREGKYMGRIYASLSVSTIIGVVCLIIIYKQGTRFYNISYWKYSLALTFPLIMHSLSHMILQQADRYMIKVLVSDYETGIYSFSYSVGLVINIIWVAFNNAWAPWYYDKTKDKENEDVLKVYKIYCMLFSLITIVFVMISPEMITIMGTQKFINAIYIAPIIAVSSFFVFLYSFPVNYEFFHKKTAFISIGTFIAALFNVLLNLILIPHYLGFGAAVATLISYILLLIMHYIIARWVIRGFQIPFKYLLYPSVIILFALILFYLLVELWQVRWAIVVLSVAIWFLFIRRLPGNDFLRQ